MAELTTKNMTVGDDSLNIHESAVTRDINQYYLWGIFAMGLPGNLLIGVTVQSLQPLSLSSLLVSVVAMLDTLAIVAKLTDQQLLLNGVRLDPFMCKLVSVFSTFFSVVAVWALVLLCVQQCVAVFYPTRKHALLSKSRSCIVLTAMSFAAFAALLVLYFVNTHSRFDVARTCAEEHDMNYEAVLVIESMHVLLPHLATTVLVMLLHCGVGEFGQNYCVTFSRGEDELDGELGSVEKTHDAGNRILVDRDEEITLVNLTRAAASMFLILSLGRCGYVVMTILNHFDVINVKGTHEWVMFTKVETLMLEATFSLKFLLYFFVSGTFRKHFVNRFLCQ